MVSQARRRTITSPTRTAWPGRSVSSRDRPLRLLSRPQHRDALAPSASCPGASRVTVCGMSTVSFSISTVVLLVLLAGARAGCRRRARARPQNEAGAARACSVGRPGLIVAARRLRAGRRARARPAGDRRAACRSGWASRAFRNLGARRQRLVGHAVDLAGQPGIPFGRHPADVVRARIHDPAAAALLAFEIDDCRARPRRPCGRCASCTERCRSSRLPTR